MQRCLLGLLCGLSSFIIGVSGVNYFQAVSQFQITVLSAREATLRNDLFQMRKMIDQYTAEKGRLPSSLDDLRIAGYIRDIPIDPITGGRDWKVITDNDPNCANGRRGIIDVHSSSTGRSSKDIGYNEW